MLSIILPSYNESANIEKIIDELLTLKSNQKIEIIVVDDDSPDGTSDLVRAKAQLEQRIKLIRRVGRAGLASAIKEGLLDATGEYAVVMDSD
jgi:dolichol-phosphate mannosyltransferase